MAQSSALTLPPEPRTIEETGLTLTFLADLTLKTMYARGSLKGHEIAGTLHLPFVNVVEQALDHLRHEHLSEVRGATGFGESSYQYVISEEGRAHARELMEQNQYVGPAPVPLQAYIAKVHAQSVAGQMITRDVLKRALAHLVINGAVLNQLGPAINSGRAVFLFGNPGNGKTTIAEAIGAVVPGTIFVPYAINVSGHIIKVFDALHHRLVPEKTDSADPHPGILQGERYDRRWAHVHRPLIAAGGELVLDSLDLIYDPAMKYYEAPFQMKANGGTFLVDDFGRQTARPRDLLNRWIVPLEKRVDYLTLTTGHKIDVPFDALIIFATNLNPTELVDEAFLRRIHYKIHIADPTWEEFREIFIRETAKHNLKYSEEIMRYIVMEYYIKPKRRPRAVHPRDLLDELTNIARFNGTLPTLSKELVDLACQTYFLKT